MLFTSLLKTVNKPDEQKNPQPTKILQVEAMLFWGYFLKSWCCSNKTLVWQPSASFLLPVKHSHLWKNFKQPRSTLPPAVAENGCLGTHLQTWLKTSVGCNGASGFDCSSSCRIGLPLTAYLIDCQQKWSHPSEWCSLHIIWIPKGLLLPSNDSQQLQARSEILNDYK